MNLRAMDLEEYIARVSVALTNLEFENTLKYPEGFTPVDFAMRESFKKIAMQETSKNKELLTLHKGLKFAEIEPDRAAMFIKYLNARIK